MYIGNLYFGQYTDLYGILIQIAMHQYQKIREAHMQFFKAGTACTVAFGPFISSLDGITLKADNTAITDIDHATTGIFLSKNGANAAIRHQSVTASIADDYGMMLVTLDTTDTNTIGTLDILFAKSDTYLPVTKSLMVIPADLYDTWMATQPAAAMKKFFNIASPTGTVNSLPDIVAGQANGLAIVGSEMAANLTKVNGVAQTATLDTIKAETVLIVADTGELQTNQGNWLTATGFATPTNITAGTITTVTNLTNVADSSGVTELLTRIPDATAGATGGLAIVGSEMEANLTKVNGVAQTATLDTIKAETALIVADTNEIQTDWANGGRLDLILDTASSGGVDVSALADAIWDEALTGHSTSGTTGKKLTDLINTDISGLATPTNITAGTITTVTNLTNVVDSSGVTELLTRIPDAIAGATGGLAIVGSEMAANLTKINGVAQTATLDTIKAETVLIVADTNELQTNQSAWASASGVTELLTRVPDATAGATGGLAIVGSEMTLGANSITASAFATDAGQEIADFVWNEPLSGHIDAGSAGAALVTTSTGGVDAAVLADVIWNELLSAHTVEGTAGNKLNTLASPDLSSVASSTNLATLQEDVTTMLENLAVVDDILDNLHGIDIPAIKVDTEAILLDTAEIGTAGAGLTTVAQAATALTNVTWTDALATKVSDIDTNVENIQSRIPTALIDGRISSDVGSIAESEEAATDLAAVAIATVRGTVTTLNFNPLITAFETTISTPTVDFYNGNYIKFTTGDLAGLSAVITDYSLEGGFGHFTVTGMVSVPFHGDAFFIY